MKKQFLICLFFLLCIIGCSNKNANVKTESNTSALIDTTDNGEQTTIPDNEKKEKTMLLPLQVKEMP